MRRIFFYLVCISSFNLFAQGNVNLNPTITPALFGPTDEIAVEYDVTGTPLASLTNAWAWVWIPGKSIDAKYNINPATAAADPAKFTKVTEAGKTLFRLTFKPADFFNQSISAETQMGILLKGNNWTGCGTSSCQTTDYIANFGFKITLVSPLANPVFTDQSSTISIQATAPVDATFQTLVDDVVVNTSGSETTSYTYVHTVTEPTGLYHVKVVGTSANGTSEVAFSYLVRGATATESLPSGIIPGINYDADPTKVTLCLWAPDKNSVYVRGDFSDWDVLPQYQMKRDGEYFWTELTGLTSGEEYAFQYLVDESIWVADPYADKILDPDDQYIPATTYPNLKLYPQKALLNHWYFNRLSVFQTNQTPYQWQATNYQRPEKEKLVVYELLIRDFFDANNRNYQNLIDTLSYLKRLGVNAIELMPIMEFNGNEGWGYNPTFMFAVDKYYGTKNKLKEFIDVCHQNDMAVILDIAMNHQDIPNSYAMMDFDFSAFKPTAGNKWFNVDPKHPYNVFFDMNHESQYTKNYIDTVNYYWLNEYKIDGYRFDLSKGFTQNTSCGGSTTNENCFNSTVDASRIAILKRMADKIWEHSPEAYVILEHFAANAEEKELAEYRAGEGKGMLFWGNLNHAYMENAMGYFPQSNINWVYHGSRGWSVPHVIGYMESHDEERMMFKNLQYGNSSGSYSVKNLPTALDRVKAAATMFYTIPGPKMLWQFGELGYDISIDDGGRLSPKPVKWDYLSDPSRYRLYQHTADLIRLRHTYDVFASGAATLATGSTAGKQLTLKNSPYTTTPVTADQMNVQVVVNFDVTQQLMQVSFPHTGTWYDYYAYGTPVTVSTTPFSIMLKPGEYKIFTDVEITNPLELVTSTENIFAETQISVYPNPAAEVLFVDSEKPVRNLQLVTTNGARISPKRIDSTSWDLRDVSDGFYIVVVEQPGVTQRLKLIKR
ncbi:MAG: T9SS type A sorting domain-containing protein [Cyclobacteriaceae bacterium]|nr:T9SS type A sorting domain-containing protein [Cyclobacteriaceae bacterium]